MSRKKRPGGGKRPGGVQGCPWALGCVWISMQDYKKSRRHTDCVSPAEYHAHVKLDQPGSIKQNEIR